MRYDISKGNVTEFGFDGQFHFRTATPAEMVLTAKEFDAKYNGHTDEDEKDSPCVSNIELV